MHENNWNDVRGFIKTNIEKIHIYVYKRKKKR